MSLTPEQIEKLIESGTEKLANALRPELLDQSVARPTEIALRRPDAQNAKAIALYNAIKNHTASISYPEFELFVDKVLCQGDRSDSGLSQLDPNQQLSISRFIAPCDNNAPYARFIPGVELYDVLKTAAEVFLLLRCGFCPPTSDYVAQVEVEGTRRGGRPGRGSTPRPNIFDILEDGSPSPQAAQQLSQFLGRDRASYIQLIIERVFPDERFGQSPFCSSSVGFGPCLLELIWSYWHEQGMLVQTANTIALRFQNVRAPRGRDPLGEFEVDPLRPLSAFLWGYIQDEPHRLSVKRRAHEYEHHYGLKLEGRALRKVRAADVRSQFLRAFHDLLSTADQYYTQATDNTVSPDPFNILVALRDLHLIMAEGAHNQFRDLPWTSRVEMLVEQWMLARREMRDFLRGRHMVPYAEPWMGAVDAMKRIQSWSDTNVTYYHDLAVFGERILLSVRYIAWNEINNGADAEDWAIQWRQEIQGYVHAYRMVTGVNLSEDRVEISRIGDTRYMQPSFHLRNRLQEQQRTPALPPARDDAGLQLGAVSRDTTRQP